MQTTDYTDFTDKKKWIRIDGKLWIQTDNTEHGIAPDLGQAGIPKSDIVLAFRPPDVRRHTEYAVEIKGVGKEATQRTSELSSVFQEFQDGQNATLSQLLAS